MSELQFWVAGHPMTKGSMRAFSKMDTTKVTVVNSNAKTKDWERLVAFTVRERTAGRRLWCGPVGLSLVFRFRRPKSHYRTGKYKHLLKENAPEFPITKKRNDYDKLARAVTDALTGVVWEDDSQVVHAVVKKQYAENEGCLITIYPIRSVSSVISCAFRKIRWLCKSEKETT